MTPTLVQLQNRIAWVEALRSGEYQQTRGALKDGHGHCCLGVGAEVLKGQTDLDWGDAEGSDGRFPFQGEAELLPPAICNLLGIDQAGLLPSPVLEHTCLWQLNDRALLPFSEIAQVIEDQFITPFLHLLDSPEGQSTEGTDSQDAAKPEGK